MKLVLNEPKYLTESISIISELVNEVTLKIKKNTIDLIALDPANVALVSFTLLSSAFSEYQIEKPKEISLQLEQFKQVLKRAKSSDSLSLLFDEEKNKLKIKIVGDTTRTFSLSLLNLDEKEQKLPDLTFPVKIIALTSSFDEAIEDMGIISDSLSLTAEKERLTISCSSPLHSAEVVIPEDEGTSVEAGSEKITSKYCLLYTSPSPRD